MVYDAPDASGSKKSYLDVATFRGPTLLADLADRDFTINYFEDERHYFVSLVPRAEMMRNMLNEVQIWFSRTDLTVTRINMVEPGGDYTNIAFTNKKLNTNISAEKFNFK